METVEVTALISKTITAIEVNEDRDEMRFACSDGATYLMKHDHDCCESVEIEDIIGSLEDLIGSPILQAEEVSEGGRGRDTRDEESPYWPEGVAKPEYAPESYTWTFYKFATIKGSVTIRWYGTSNGYYSESVSFFETKQGAGE